MGYISESNQERRDRQTGDVEIDLKKEILASLTDVLEAATSGGMPTGSPNTMTNYRFAAFQAVLAREAEKAANKNITIQGDNLEVTRKVLRLSYVLLFVTVAQVVLAFCQWQRPNLQQQPNYPANDRKTNQAEKALEGPVDRPPQH